MRWPKLVVGLLALGIFCYAFLYIWPWVGPVIARHPAHLLSAILDSVLQPHPDQGIGKYYPAVLLGSAAMMYVVISYDLKMRKRSTHGTAHHASGSEARKYYAPRSAPKFQRPGRALQSFLPGGSRQREQHYLYLGKHRGRSVALGEQQQYQHLLLTAPTGAGKSARFFIPNLLRETGLRSLFIADLKNELYKVTAGWLSQSMQIWLFAPTQPTISAGYNPLAHIRSVEDAQDFAETWVANTSKNEKDSFWDTNSKLLISAMALHLLATERAPAFSRLADILTTQSYEQIRDMLRTTRSHDARYIALQFIESMEKNERLVGSQMSDTGNRFQLLASPNARAVTSTNTIDFEEMIETPTAFFLSIPRTATKRYRPLMACLTQQMFAAWEQRGTNGIGCYLDEFTNLGYIPGYAEFISTARSLKVSLLMAIQNFSQLNERYGKNDADTIKANAVTHLLLPGAGLEETKYYSERMGDTTVATETVNRRGYGLSEEITSTQGEARRRLMTSDELRTMPEDQMLMIEAKSPALLLTTKLYFTEKQMVERANWPYQVTRVRPEPEQPAPASYAQGLPAAPQTRRQEPPIVVDGSTEEEEDDDQASQYIQPE